MNIKELRLKCKLTQQECAEYLGVSLRSYQSYESDKSKYNSAKYNFFCKRLQEYKVDDNIFKGKFSSEYYTNVIKDKNLLNFKNIVKTYKKRDCFYYLKKYLDEDFSGKICILYGLRRTGKTTMIFQAISELPLDKTVYIKVEPNDTMSRLSKDLKKLYDRGYKYVFIDEITLMKDFIGTAAVLSDVFSMFGMKIVLSGTDSLSFALADRDELYDRNIMIHTTYISFKEYSYLLHINSIDEFIEYGGTLKKENMSFGDKDAFLDEVSFRSEESTRKYIDSSISRNIQHSLKNDKNGEYFNQLRELFEANELTNVINRFVEKMNHRFVLNVIEEKFKSHDLGSAKQLLLHEMPKDRAHVLYDVDEEKIVERLKALIEIKEKDETKIKVDQGHVEKIKKYLMMLDLIYNCPTRIESSISEDNYIFTQPGMRYSIAKALVYSLLQDDYFNSIQNVDRESIINKILEDVKGKMLEDIVLVEVNKFISNQYDAFKFKFDKGGEFDMVVYDRKNNCCSIYEIKHSQKVSQEQYRHLVNEENLKTIEYRFGRIDKKCVLYRGLNGVIDLENGIHYYNVEDFLKNMKAYI